ncbi:Kinetochore-binding protein 3 [Caenorhabditis elegans]|uniref:Kinetochore-binding protein 3 n=1 Tax=Caenorhabditis elegans TaxID=6239 RepID=KBP3_CAEEL|nr:Kinetochore-binding protein 3 [Caenorhabditis elegans]O45406.3 RecName: Full=Kinetochore-binding protein 3 [Caenorhabditis elegans]AAG50208.1 2O676 [Caenorhabditis elegans]CAB04194.3 Kinetochore-binding protein 3 [Caenorhabditis elegans]|eukprot:NP_496993.1 Kinetochore-binding protein 3 [Caenorhabditis elegans]
MESLNEYMDKIINRLKAVNEKDELVDEGMRKLQKCQEKIMKTRIDAQKHIDERHEQQSFEQQLLNKNMFETEQLEEKLKRLDDENKIGNEREFNKKLEAISAKWTDDVNLLKTTPNEPNDGNRKKLSNLSNILV